MHISFDINLIRAIITLVSFALFVVIVLWAYRPTNRARFEADGRLILDDSFDHSIEGSIDGAFNHSVSGGHYEPR
jgi:cbb3-type cytochrome oxidase subunit 3